MLKYFIVVSPVLCVLENGSLGYVYISNQHNGMDNIKNYLLKSHERFVADIPESLCNGLLVCYFHQLICNIKPYCSQ